MRRNCAGGKKRVYPTHLVERFNETRQGFDLRGLGAPILFFGTSVDAYFTLSQIKS